MVRKKFKRTVPKGKTKETCNIWSNWKKLLLILFIKISTIYSKESIFMKDRENMTCIFKLTILLI